jgi:hypothetical protein
MRVESADEGWETGWRSPAPGNMEVGREEYAIVKGKSAGEDDRENKALLE